MDQLPVEILVKILALACFDDSATAYSLALTCKRLTDVAEFVRFEAVSLCGLSQLSRFTAILEDSPHISEKIRHLFVSELSRGEAEVRRLRGEIEMRKMAVSYRIIENPTGVDDGLYNEDNNDDDDDVFACYDHSERERKQEAFYGAFHSIMQHVSTSLHTLFITTTFYGTETFPPFPMPNLTNFYFTSTYTEFSIHQTFPKLKRIITNCCMRERRVDLRSHAPVLEELRITNIGEAAAGFVGALVKYAQCREAGTKDGALLPDTMKRVILQQSPPPYGAWCGNAWLQHEDFEKCLLQAAFSVARHDNGKAGLRLVLLEKSDLESWCKGRVRGLYYTSFCDARADWLDGVCGDGSWDNMKGLPYEIGGRKVSEKGKIALDT
jgi:hypothetical protein